MPFQPGTHGAPGGDTSYCANFQLFGITGRSPTVAANFQGSNKAVSVGYGLSNTIFMAERLAFCGTAPAGFVLHGRAARGDNAGGGQTP